MQCAIKIEDKTREDLIIQYAPLVKTIVERIACKVPSHIAEKEELLNVGIIGLISALAKFDSRRNVQFETYARYRIKGAVLDELRLRDWMPRSTRHKYSRLQDAFAVLQKMYGRPANDEEVCAYLAISMEEYHELIEEAKGVSVLSNQDLPVDFYERYRTETLGEAERESPLGMLARRELRDILRKAIEKLPEKEKLVLSLYYYEELTMKEIGEVMSLTESRVCQLHSKAVLRLRGELKVLNGDYNGQG
jgi:RNA polymerase sigma factor FliA